MPSITTWTFEPKEPLELARTHAHQEGTALLYSGGTLDSAKNSFLCLFPKKKVSVQAREGCWEELKERLDDVPFWVGYLGYEMGAFADPDKPLPFFRSSLPDARFYAPSVVVHFNHQNGVATLHADKAISLQKEAQKHSSGPFRWVSSSDTLESYLQKIAAIQEAILDGEYYQLNLSQEFRLEGKCDPFTLFEQVVELNPAPFSAFLNCGDFSIVSSSPERLLHRIGDQLETRPIKGTMPRGHSEKEDHQNRRLLLESEKEKAELLMITDLMRNDLGKICLPGSVTTEEIWRCEAYTNVFHLLSVISGRVQPGLHPVDIVRSLFPGGSVTGCPKLRAMEAIAQLEQRPRGLYTGSIGYFTESGNFDFNIAIRTLIVHGDSLNLQLGGAIVIDSDPVKEFEETLHKGKTLFKALGINEHSLF